MDMRRMNTLADANIFKRSWEVTKVTFSVMLKNKKMFWFVIVDNVLSLMAFIPLILVGLFIGGLIPGDIPMVPFIAASLLVGYFLSYIFTVFFDVCTVYAAKKEFSDDHAETGEIISFAFSRLGRIILWALLSGTVGLALKAMKGKGGRGGRGMARRAAGGILGTAWSILTIFVIPEIVYRDSRPIAAIKNSFGTVKKTWGELLIRWFGLNMVEGIISVVFLLFFGVIGFTGLELGIQGLLVAAFLGYIIVQIPIVITFAIANQVYDAALYEYAHTGKVPGSYDEDMLKNAFRPMR